MNGNILRYAYLSIGASLLTLILKFGAFFMTGSVGLLSDATESIVNLTAGIVALFALAVARMPADKNHAYGHGKAEYFSSATEGLLILFAATGIVYASIARFLRPVPLEHLGPGLVVAVLAAGVNYFTAKAMLRASIRFDSITLEADAKHLLTDVWTSVGVVLGLGALVFLPPGWEFIDPLIGSILAVNIAFTGWGLVKRSVQGLMDVALPEDDVAQIRDAIRAKIDSNADFHDLRTRKSGAKRFAELHLLVPGRMSVRASHDLCCDIEKEIRVRLGDVHVNIHVEPWEDARSFEGAHEWDELCPKD